MRTREQARAAYTHLRPSRVAEQLDCSVQHVINLIKRGHLPAKNIGTARRPEYRIAPESLEAFLDARTVEPVGAE